jgi:hypothetical protein
MIIGCQGLDGNGARCPMDYCRSHLSHKKRGDEKLNERIS